MSFDCFVRDEPPPPSLFFEAGDVWKYLDDGSDQDSAWQELAFDDGSWLADSAHFGFGDGDETTLLASGFVTYYFRKKVTVEDPNSLGNVVFSIVHDDGMLLHINGVEAARSDLIPAGPVDYQTGCTKYIPNDEENDFHRYQVPNTMFVTGENIIAIEVHQQKVSSSDVSFDCFVRDEPLPNGVLDESGILFNFQLSQNYPNPFNPSTTIEFSVPKSGFYSLKVYDISGQHVADLVSNNMSIGTHNIVFESGNLSSGIYIYKLVGKNVNISRKMVLMK